MASSAEAGGEREEERCGAGETLSAHRPQSARAFSSREYEEAKRRVRRLDAAASGGGLGAPMRRDSGAAPPPLRADGARLAAGAAGGAGADQPPLRSSSSSSMPPPPPPDTAQRDADFVSNLRRNIAELRECIVGRLTPYPQLQVSHDLAPCTHGAGWP